MKIETTNYKATFNLRCPRCGKDEWSENTYNSGVRLYHKCINCGADVSCINTKGGNDIVMVIEDQFKNYKIKCRYHAGIYFDPIRKQHFIKCVNPLGKCFACPDVIEVSAKTSHVLDQALNEGDGVYRP